MSLLNEISVVNSALADVGNPAIASFSPSDGTLASDIATLKYESLRDSTLSMAWWGFARRFATLAALTATDNPTFGFTNGFGLPSDYIVIVRTEDNENFQLYDTGTATALASNSSEVKIEYIARITNTTRWDDLFTQAITTGLASSFALGLLHNSKYADGLLAKYERLVELAGVINGRNDNNPKFVESNILLEVRGLPTRRPDKVLQPPY